MERFYVGIHVGVYTPCGGDWALKHVVLVLLERVVTVGERKREGGKLGLCLMNE